MSAAALPYTVLMLLVEYPPGGADPVHRHDAHGFIYVLEGSIVMQVKGGQEVTLTSGQTFYEGPEDVHAVGRNASSTVPAIATCAADAKPRTPSSRQVRARTPFQILDRSTTRGMT